MRKTTQHLERLISALRGMACALLVIAPLAATAAPADEEIVWKMLDEFVKLVPQDAAAPPNQHPVKLRDADLAVALGKIRLRKNDETTSLMDKKDAERLAPHLAQALSKASPRQDVVFAILIWVKAEIIGSHDVTIAGRAFYAGGKLNIILGDLWRSAISPDYRRAPVAPRAVDRRLYPHEPGLRAKETVHEGLSFETGPGIQLFALNGRPRQDWLVLDVEMLAAPAIRAPSEGERASAPVPEKATTAEERLTRLKRLHDQGLITDEEYARKRKEIVDQL